MYSHAKPQRRHRRDYRGDAAIGIYLCTICALVGCFFVGLYELMQPTRYPNPGLAAYKPAPTIAYVEQLRNEREPSGRPEFAYAIEPGSETPAPAPGTGETVPLPKQWSPEAQFPVGKKAEKPNRKIVTVVSKQPRAVRERRDAARERRDAAQTIINQISANNRTAGY
jgi:hypothetical protein